MSVVAPTNYKILNKKPRLSTGLHDDVGCDVVKVTWLRPTHSPECDLSVIGWHRLREASSGGLTLFPLSLAFAWKAIIVDDPLAVLQFNVVAHPYEQRPKFAHKWNQPWGIRHLTLLVADSPSEPCLVSSLTKPFCPRPADGYL